MSLSKVLGSLGGQTRTFAERVACETRHLGGGALYICFEAISAILPPWYEDDTQMKQPTVQLLLPLALSS